MCSPMSCMVRSNIQEYNSFRSPMTSKTTPKEDVRLLSTVHLIERVLAEDESVLEMGPYEVRVWWDGGQVMQTVIP